MPPVCARPADNIDGSASISGRAGATASEIADRRRASRSRMAEEIPLESGSEYHRHEPQRRAAIFESPHAYVLVLRQRTAQTGPLLRSFATATVAVYSRAGAGAHGKRKRHGAQLVLEHGGALLEMSRHWRSCARQE